jgi:hypothetical protein
MLFKDLKEIMTEADEVAQEETPAPEGENPEPVEKETPKKAKRDVEAVKNASDGIGHEAYKLSTTLETKLETSLTNLYNIKDVKVNNNTVYINFDKPNVYKMKQNGFDVTEEDMVAQIQSVILAILGVSGDDFDLDSKILPGVITISVYSKLEKEANKK